MISKVTEEATGRDSKILTIFDNIFEIPSTGFVLVFVDGSPGQAGHCLRRGRSLGHEPQRDPYLCQVLGCNWQHFLLCCLNEGEFPRHSCRLSTSVVVNIHTIAIVLNLFFNISKTVSICYVVLHVI